MKLALTNLHYSKLRGEKEVILTFETITLLDRKLSSAILDDIREATVVEQCISKLTGGKHF